VDLNAEAGKKAIASLKNAHFHQTNVADYAALLSAFEATWSISGRLDFVYANAGIVERDNFYEEHPLDVPPPQLNQLSIDVNFKSVVNTSWLARHFFRKSLAKHERGRHDAVLIMTASCGGLYASEFCPLYSGSKAAVIMFNRAIANGYHQQGIRTFTTCPGTIRTNLLKKEEWDVFSDEIFTPMETLVNVVMKLIDGDNIEDAKGKKVKKEDNWGLTVEVNKNSFYFRDQPEASDDLMKAMMQGCRIDASVHKNVRSAMEANDRKD
jgi:NAD(P)-dependent dehydrogenase (short-subunit alcohol dehydrogenase family)